MIKVYLFLSYCQVYKQRFLQLIAKKLLVNYLSNIKIDRYFFNYHPGQPNALSIKAGHIKKVGWHSLP